MKRIYRFFFNGVVIVVMAMVINGCSEVNSSKSNEHQNTVDVSQNSSTMETLSIITTTDTKSETIESTSQESIEFVTIGLNEYPIDIIEITSGNMIFCFTQEDINEVSKLKNLKKLIIDPAVHNADLSPLKELPNLIDLCINDDTDSIQDISPIWELVNLEKLRIVQRTLSDISSVTKLTNLKELSLNSWNITDISPLAELNNLVYLDLSSLNSYNNSISDISPLTELTNLTYLNLYNNLITDISPLKELTNLEYLYLGNNYSISPSDINELKIILPNCIIDFNFSQNMSEDDWAIVSSMYATD